MHVGMTQFACSPATGGQTKKKALRIFFSVFPSVFNCLFSACAGVIQHRNMLLEENCPKRRTYIVLEFLCLK